MIGRGLAVPIVALSVAAACCGCGTTKPSRFYTLDATATPSNAPATNIAVLVGPVSVPASVDRPEFVVQVAANRVEIDEFNRWAAPLNDSIARAVAGDLAVLLATPQVASAPLANFRATYRVTIDVLQFQSIRGQAAQIDAVWTIRAADSTSQSGRTLDREPVQSGAYDELAAAHSRALAKVSGDIANAIRTKDSATHAEAQAAKDHPQSGKTRGQSFR